MQSEPRRVETIFHQARARESAVERAAYLDGACSGDAGLRARVEALLAAHDEASGFLESPAVDAGEEPGNRIGPYKLLQEIGSGGMGVVYMAEQEKPVRRKVALKVIKLGMDTKQVIARFEAERQALAMMDHAGIARVLEAGATDSGRPYFVMELVRGIPIDAYCDTHNLPLRERLGLFVDVCRAVQHAHNKGIIHRDLKPTNVLVTSHDGKPVPKIIDFGVSKATSQRLTEKTLFTEFRQFIGTPEYMSPEQAEMSGLDVDTRSDVYSLGVLLYNLLTGTTPVDAKTLRDAGYGEMTRIIREREALAPSTCISKLGETGADVARKRDSDPGALAKLFRGDLDWIVMKALEKDRTRRYETAAAFADDVERHLQSRPVEAGPPGALYRMSKFVRRNKKAVVLSGLVALALLLGLFGTTAGFLRARDEALRSTRISDSLLGILAATDPVRAAALDFDARSEVATMREVFGDEHPTVAATLHTLGSQLFTAGDFAAAESLFREALAVWKRAYGEDHANVAITLSQLGKLLRVSGKDDEAESALREAVRILDGLPDEPGLASYEARRELADLLSNRGQYDEAVTLHERALAVLRAQPTKQPFRIIETLEQMLMVMISSKRAGEARDVARQIYAEARAFYPEDSPILAMTAFAHGNLQAQAGDLAAAEPYLREAIERFRACGDPPPVYYMAAGDAMFQILRNRTDPESVAEADRLLEELIELARPLWGPEQIVGNLAFLARRLTDREIFDGALDASLDAYRVGLEAGLQQTQLAELREMIGRAACEPALRRGLSRDVYAKALSALELALESEPERPVFLAVSGALLYRLGELERAAEQLERLARPLCEESDGPAKIVAPMDRGFLALVWKQLGDPERARASLDSMRASMPANAEDSVRALLAEAEELVGEGE